MARVSYMAPWWVNLLHRLPHFSLRWEPTSGQFRPKDPDCQRALLLLGAAALACLALELLFLLLYSFWLCCQRRGNEGHLDADCCCTAWCVVIATLVCSTGITVGFCGNGETSDGVHRATYSLRHANRMVAGVQDSVWDTAAALNLTGLGPERQAELEPEQQAEPGLGPRPGLRGWAAHSGCDGAPQRLRGLLPALVGGRGTVSPRSRGAWGSPTTSRPRAPQESGGRPPEPTQNYSPTGDSEDFLRVQ